ncbi:MAG: DNA-deoxyinosine glycosylase [Gammaproteobacteria bacterium]|jgi:TDG/mug DNA glycosylase family protein|nr:DNA-deoxyinosine glycosylase [Gammaproteobacteria bacterium]
MSKQEAGRENAEVSKGFPPIARQDARVLVLGSLPSRASLRARQYYAHPRNAFWTIMLEIAGADGSYASRCRSLREQGIAVWDVLSSSVRPGSLDADIDMTSAVPNDFEGFLAGHRDIRLVCFNGRKAQQLFERYVQPLQRHREPALALLPSTSPANASLTMAEKLEAWRGIIEPALGKDKE